MTIEEIEEKLPISITNSFYKYQGNDVLEKSIYMISTSYMGMGSYHDQIWFFNSVDEFKEFVPALIFMDLVMEEEEFDWEGDYSEDYELYKKYLEYDSLEKLMDACEGCWGECDFCIKEYRPISILYQEMLEAKNNIDDLKNENELFQYLQDVKLSVYSKQIIYQYLGSTKTTIDYSMDSFLSFMADFEFYGLEFE